MSHLRIAAPWRNLATVLGFVLAALTVTGCPKSYPDCDDDSTCKKHNEVCVDGRCHQCRDNSQCSAIDACQTCQGNACVRRPGCCKSDLDCPNGKCWKQGDGETGQCGGVCQTNSDCPSGLKCAGGQCVPDVACTDDSFCPNGQKCQGGKCVAGCEVQIVLFDFNEYTIRLDQEGMVSSNAQCLKSSGNTVSVEGHCDERGADEYNLALGQRRAASVARQYKTLGVSEGQIKSVISFGEEKPVCSESSEDCWRRNRRAETVQK